VELGNSLDKNIYLCQQSNIKHSIMALLNNVESIYNEIVLLSNADRDNLYNRMQREFYRNSEIVAYTTDGKALTHEQYQKRVNIGIEQCMRGESIDLEEFSKELGYNYADL
jgi:intein/homing endonuclease